MRGGRIGDDIISLMGDWLPHAARRAAQPARMPEGLRLYAIGDVHGQSALLARLLHQIEADARTRKPSATRLVFLGDLIDRGRGSAAILRAFAALEPDPNRIVLMGNHEATLVEVHRGDHDAARLWLRHGGRATLEGFGVPPAEIDEDDVHGTVALVREAIPSTVLAWLAGLPLFHRAGGYFLVHAGVRPGVALKRQAPADMLWIRDRFLSSERDFGAVVVHGHSIEEDARVRPNRIGIDTGAYRTGRLSAIGLEGAERWLVDVDDPALIL